MSNIFLNPAASCAVISAISERGKNKEYCESYRSKTTLGILYVL